MATLQLQPPNESHLARKRSIPQSTPGMASKKSSKMTVTDKSQRLKTIRPKDRVEEFPHNHLTVQNSQLFCLACRESISCKKSAIVDHIGCPKRLRNCERLANQKVADYELTEYLTKNITTENAGAFTKTRDVDMQVFNVKWVQN